MIFDVLQEAGVEVLRLPLAARRARLPRLLTDGPAELPLCPQTIDTNVALTWYAHGADAGIEGLVIKALTGTYRPGRADWLKIKKRVSVEAIVGGVIGRLTDPIALLLGRLDQHDRLRYVGHTVPLSTAQRHELGTLLPVVAWHGPSRGHPWPRPLPAGWLGRFDRPQAVDYIAVEPVMVVEVSADIAWEHGRWVILQRYFASGWTWKRRMLQAGGPARRANSTLRDVASSAPHVLDKVTTNVDIYVNDLRAQS
ncbi:ATP-dependent DNA ligase [Micromonospora maris]|uniref:ATP-dependent DNA ligase family profile domain-containing protein n=1 Tax=Micromonospora maris TaxID=1003110 RepID=A0A9X0LFB8_9ACTN|nr:ATP dependent DNA ligase [Micromonospora maris AB-18-032]KUJ48093.1 hypothetical protein ADL17_03145 [Micromonospora maris]